jgi:hypothetical protein
MVSKEEFKDIVLKSWVMKNDWDAVIDFYNKLDSRAPHDILKRRMALIDSLESELLVPEQTGLLEYARQNAGDTIFFENGGTFGWFFNNFANILYADAVSVALKEKGKKAVCFSVIDPTDISRVERTIIFGGSKFKIPLTREDVGELNSTGSLAPPSREMVDDYLNKLEKELSDDTKVAGFQKEDRELLMGRFKNLRGEFYRIVDDT